MSIRLPQISPAQCKRARAMLKWNPQDLASRGRVQVKRIEMFERNQLRLARPENDEIVKLFQKFHIDFRPGNEVVFSANTPSGRNSSGSTVARHEHQEGQKQVVTLADGVTTVHLQGQSDWGEIDASKLKPKPSE